MHNLWHNDFIERNVIHPKITSSNNKHILFVEHIELKKFF